MKKVIGLATCLLVLQSCSLPQAVSYNVSHSMGAKAPQKAPSITNVKRKIGKPYSIPNEHGQPIWYTPIQNSEGYREHGMASWYGKDFHAKKTANGEDYNMYAYTAAHKTLPLPTYVRVTNTQNGKSIVVRVNDRGPFYKKRLIDMSYAGAKALGFDKQGTAPVLVEAISIYGGDVNRSRFGTKNMRYAQQSKPNFKPTPREAAAINKQKAAYSSFTTRIANRNKAINQTTNVQNSSPEIVTRTESKYFIQLGSFSDINNARNLYYKARRNIGNVKITSLPINNRMYHRVIIDKIKDVDHAAVILDNIKAYGFNEAIITTKN
jgi:rare lipoprotein A